MGQLSAGVFVIRIWQEGTADVDVSWRGYVEHIASGQRRYFCDLSEALEFVSALGTGTLPEAPMAIRDQSVPPVPPLG